MPYVSSGRKAQMPELPEVETIVRGLRRLLVGRTVSSVKVLDARVLNVSAQKFRAHLRNCGIARLGRLGKYALFFLAGEKLLVVHLGMSGQLRWLERNALVEKHTHLVFDFATGRRQLRFRDVRRFGKVFLEPTHHLSDIPYLALLGPDARRVSLEELTSALKGRARPVKSALMDQHLIAGLGNIYTDEVLYRAHIHPRQSCGTLKAEEIARLHSAIKETLEAAIRLQGSSVSDYVKADGRPGQFALYHQVYRKHGKPCGRCGAIIQRIVLGGRGTHFCPSCQCLRRRGLRKR